MDAEPPPSYTPLIALPVLVLDLETTGLDVARDRVIQVGAYRMSGARIDAAPALDRLVDPGAPVPEAATRICGLGDADVRGAETVDTALAEFARAVTGRVVVGHHVGFDLAILRHEAARVGAPWADPVSLDTALLAGALAPALRDLSLESLADWLGVEIHARHSALGDSAATAEVFASLVPRLLERGVRTLGEARRLAESRADLLERQRQAGWDRVPDDAHDVVAPRPAVRLDSYVYARRLVDVMRAPPRTVAPHASLRQAAWSMSESRVGSLLVVDDAGRPAGIVTERDVLRAVGRMRSDLDRCTVLEAMSAPVESMDGGEMLCRALGRMTRRGIRHLCVIDADGVALGLVSQRDLARHRATTVHVLGDALDVAEDVSALAEVHGQLPRVAAALVEDGFGALAAARVISGEVRGITARAATLAARALTRKMGPAPAPWCLLVLGSAGRGESLLTADQDNALIHAGTADDDPWFAALGASVADMLHGAGVPRCQGGIMAANVEWRGSREDWRARVDGWLGRARPRDLLHVDIFYDLWPVSGEFELAAELHREAVAAACANPPFLALLSESIAGMSPPLNFFGGLRGERGRVDLKLGALLPLVGIARVLALRVGTPTRSTPDRLKDAVARGRLNEADARRLTAIHQSLLNLVLRQQLEDLRRGIQPSNRVEEARLDRDAHACLKRDLKRLEEILGTLRGAVSG